MTMAKSERQKRLEEQSEMSVKGAPHH